MTPLAILCRKTIVVTSLVEDSWRQSGLKGMNGAVQNALEEF